MLAGDGAERRGLSHPPRIIRLAGQLNFLPGLLQGGGMGVQLLKPGKAVVIGGQQRGGAFQHQQIELRLAAAGNLRGGGVVVEQGQLAEQGAVGGLQETQSRARVGSSSGWPR